MNRSKKLTRSSRFTLFILLVGTSFLFAQRSYHYENFGNQSILLNGNVTGSVSDLGAVYYNPARLAFEQDSSRFSIEGKFYELTKTSLSNFLGNGLDVSNSDFSGLPGMIAGTFTIKKELFTYSFLSRNRYSTTASYESGVLDGAVIPQLQGDERFSALIDVRSELKEEWFGLSWAKRISPNFSVGASLFLSLFRSSGGDRIQYALLADTQDVGLYENESSFEQRSTGLFAKLGAAYTFKSLELGLNIDLPYLQLGGKGSFKYVELLAGTTSDIFTINNLEDLSAQRKVPLGIRFGAGIPIQKHKLHLNMSWYGSQKFYDRINIPNLQSETNVLPEFVLQERLNSVFNVGAGAELQLSDRITAIASFSTDYSPLKKDSFLFDDATTIDEVNILALDNFHYGLGSSIEIKNLSFTLGAIYSSGRSTFERTLSFPLETADDSGFDLKITRWRFLIGASVDLSKFKLLNTIRNKI